ncbi:MAG: helix-turn-helix domain-containing protein [Eubacterium sp.]|nr:helix-turn-helix domain-containing protein [Eubacterium sp.]
MSEIYESIITGLKEALADAQGKEKLQKRTVTIIPVKQYSASEIKEIRKKTNFSQKLFAEYVGVSDKTVEAWESGRSHPAGSSSRILSLIDQDSNFINEHPFVKIEN